MLEKDEELWMCAGYTYAQALAEEGEKKKKEKTFENTVPSQYHEFSKVFSEEASERLPDHRPGLDHPIDLTDDAPTSLNGKAIHLAEKERQWLHTEIDSHLRRGLVRPSTSPFATPVFIIKKKNGNFWIIMDYRKLNDITVKNKYPLPLIEAILDQIQGAWYFTKLNV